jgi:N-acetylglucosamine-6-phosphate deacetylase
MRVDCNQSTVQRFLASRTKTITPAVRKMLEYAGIDEKDCINASVKNAFDNAHIRQALGQVWDGNDASAQKLAKLIVTIAPLVGLDRSTAN